MQPCTGGFLHGRIQENEGISDFPQKNCEKVLTEGGRCGIILERQGPPERMTSESGRSKAKRTNMDTLKNEPQVRKDRKASEKSA